MAKNRRNQNIPVDDMYNVWIDNFSNREQQQLYEATQAWAENLRQSTIDSSLSAASTRSDLTVEQTWLKYERDIHSLVWFLSVIDELLEEIKDTKKWISKKWLTKAWKKTMNEAKAKLKQYEKQLETKKKALLKQKRAEIYDNDISNLRNLWQQVNQVRQDIWMWQRGNFANTASYLYNSPEIARKSNKRQASNLEFNQDFQKELETWAIARIFNWNVEKANEFFRRIAQWEYDWADYQLFVTNSAVLTPCCQRYWIRVPCNPKSTKATRWRIERTSWTSRTSPVDYSNLDYWEAFQQWWIVWLIDKTLSYCKNMTPWQRNTWKSVAVLWGFAAWIWWLYKFYTSKRSFLTKAWITAAAIFWTQALTWEWPVSLFKKLMTWWFTKEYMEDKFWYLFWDAVDWIQNSWIENWNELSWAMYSMMIFNEKAKVWDVRTLATKFKNNRQEWEQCRLDAITKLRRYGKNRAERFSAVFSENFDENKWNEWLNSIWIYDWVDDNKLVYELASSKSINTMIINKFLSDNWVKVTDNKTKKEEFEQYKKSMNDSNQAIDIAVLENHKYDRFKDNNDTTFTDRQKDVQNKEKLQNQIDQLSIDDQKKFELKKAAELFYDERSIESKPELSDFSLTMDGNFIILTSHWGYKSKIDIDKNEIVGFWNGIRFTNLAELLNTADLANKILESQRWKTPKSLPAFQYKWPSTIFENWIGKKWRWIYFNDAEFSRNLVDFDTRVLSWGWRWTIGKIDTLCDHPKEYAKYLSDRWVENNKSNINIEAYSILKWLSDSWIIFINEKEVKEAEIRLSKVKEMRSTANGWTQWYKPYSIEWEKLVFSTSDTQNATKLYFPDEFPNDFSWKSQDLWDFPSILNNKNTFLDYMNNIKNWMRWSKLNS